MPFYATLRPFTFPLRPFTLLYATLLYFTVFRHIVSTSTREGIKPGTNARKSEPKAETVVPISILIRTTVVPIRILIARQDCGE